MPIVHYDNLRIEAARADEALRKLAEAGIDSASALERIGAGLRGLGAAMFGSFGAAETLRAELEALHAAEALAANERRIAQALADVPEPAEAPIVEPRRRRAIVSDEDV